MYLPFFIATTSGHNVQKWKGRKLSRKNVKKLLIEIAVGAVVVKVVRDVRWEKAGGRTQVCFG